MEKESNKMTSNIPSTQCVTNNNRKQILNYLNHQVNKQADKITNAQLEIAAVKVVLCDAKQRLERIKNRENQPK